MDAQSANNSDQNGKVQNNTVNTVARGHESKMQKNDGKVNENDAMFQDETLRRERRRRKRTMVARNIVDYEDKM